MIRSRGVPSRSTRPQNLSDDPNVALARLGPLYAGGAASATHFHLLIVNAHSAIMATATVNTSTTPQTSPMVISFIRWLPTARTPGGGRRRRGTLLQVLRPGRLDWFSCD